ncbi:5144_t:CDS:2 [Cetraspora pellucida]|uniref:5144_t:CDS:1 n=1 Tax=Cetraspora pellucida TaxID=1433469 RepID=A0A9N9JBH5_9GLOM|nr:5144_t:CDS:2 [Cetraspora pellucida]
MIRTRKFLMFNRIVVISNNRLLRTTAYRDKQKQEHISPDQPHHSSPKDENPQGTGPTREKPMTEGHAINKAKEALGIMKDTATSATEKVKDVFTRMTTPNALDTQAEAVAKGLKEKTQQLKDKGRENLENAKNKGYDTIESVKEKGHEMMKNEEGLKEKCQGSTDKGAAKVDSSREQSDRQREPKERLANPKPIDRHPKGPIEEIKQSVHDVADATKEQNKK